MQQKKVFVPGTYNLNTLIGSIRTQKNKVLVCDAELAGSDPPASKAQEMQQYTSNVERILLSSKGDVANRTLFQNASAVNFYTAEGAYGGKI